MAGQKIAITIRRDGTVKATTLGIKGKACLDYIPLLEDLLDAETVESSFTDEYTAAEAHTTASTKAAATERVREQGS